MEDNVYCRNLAFMRCSLQRQSELGTSYGKVFHDRRISPSMYTTFVKLVYNIYKYRKPNLMKLQFHDHAQCSKPWHPCQDPWQVPW